MRKIVVYTENYQRGGGNQYFIDVINSLPENSEIIILSNKGGIFEQDFNKIKGVYTYLALPIWSVHTLVYKPLKILTNTYFLFFYKVCTLIFRVPLVWIFKKINYNTLSKSIKTFKPDLIISCNGGYPGALSCLDCIKVANNAGIKVWLSVVSMPQKKSVVELLYKNILQKCDKLIVNAENIAAAFIKSKRVIEEQIFVLHNCLPDNTILTHATPPRSYSPNLNNYNIGYIGRIEKSKGIFYLLDAFEKLVFLFPNLRLILVGTGSDLDKAVSYCKSKAISDKVDFTGYYSGAIGNVLKTFDLFVFPSLWEGLPYSVLEAMANGKLVISTNVGGIPEIITDGYNGFLVPPANTHALIMKIQKVIENNHDIKNISSKALKTIQEQFSAHFFKNKIQMLFTVDAMDKTKHINSSALLLETEL